jgi:hypothetical protein
MLRAIFPALSSGESGQFTNDEEEYVDENDESPLNVEDSDSLCGDENETLAMMEEDEEEGDTGGNYYDSYGDSGGRAPSEVFSLSHDLVSHTNSIKEKSKKETSAKKSGTRKLLRTPKCARYNTLTICFIYITFKQFD